MITTTCLICNNAFQNLRKLSKHLRDKHNHLQMKNYYDRYCKTENEGRCLICNNPTKFIITLRGYSEICSKKCQGILVRQRLRANPEKFHQFCQKMTDKNIDMWKNWRKTGKDVTVAEKLSKSLKMITSKMSQLERSQKFGWVNKLPLVEKTIFIRQHLAKSLFKWKREISDDAYLRFIAKRRKAIIKSRGFIDFQELGIDILQDYLIYKKQVYNLTEQTYNKYQTVINPQSYRRSWHDFQLDHKYSINQGFIDKIKPEIIASVYNLEMLKAFENGSKNNKCSITKEELIQNYDKDILSTRNISSKESTTI